MTQKQINGIIIILISLYVPSYIGMYILPDHWLDKFTTYWWTIPTLLTLFISAFSGASVGLNKIFGDL